MSGVAPPAACTATSSLGPSIIERAFELARSGACQNVAEVGLQLKRERFDSVEAHLAGTSIRRELRQLCSTVKAQRQSAQSL